MSATRWGVVAPFFSSSPDADNRWIDDFVRAPDLVFTKFGASANRSAWHTRSGRGTPLAEWRDIWNHAAQAFDADGIITVFPQLATAAGLRKRLGGKKIPLVAWCFNIGRLPGGARRMLAKFALREATRIVVHSTDEVPLLTDYLGVAPGIVQFVPLQRGALEPWMAEETAHPFAVAMGSANRDYPLLIEAARRSGLPLKIVAAPRLIAGLDVPDNVELLSNLTSAQCLELAQRARLSIVPLADVDVASGQVTVVEAMRLRRPIIATRSTGTQDYIEHGYSGLLVPQGDVPAMSEAMERLWQDADLRGDLCRNAAAFAAANLSDEAAAVNLERVLREAMAACN